MTLLGLTHYRTRQYQESDSRWHTWPGREFLHTTRHRHETICGPFLLMQPPQARTCPLAADTSNLDLTSIEPRNITILLLAARNISRGGSVVQEAATRCCVYSWDGRTSTYTGVALPNFCSNGRRYGSISKVIELAFGLRQTKRDSVSKCAVVLLHHTDILHNHDSWLTVIRPFNFLPQSSARMGVDPKKGLVRPHPCPSTTYFLLAFRSSLLEREAV